MFSVLTLLLFLATASLCFGQPVITNQPQTQAVAPGANVTFDVGARGTAPLTYQWQKSPGNGFSDLANCTNAVLVLTNAQPWDATDYRVVVVNLGGARTSSVAHLYVMAPGLLTNTVVLDNFDDNRVTGWTWSGSGTPFPLLETNQQFSVHGYWPGMTTWNMSDTFAVGYLGGSWSLKVGQTLEWRVDLTGMDEHASAACLELVNAADDGAYVFSKGRDFIHLSKVSFPGSAPNFGHFVHDMTLIQNSNAVLALALTRATPNLILTLRILDKANHNAVLYERSVVDTSNVDRTLTHAELDAASGMHLNTGTDIYAPPWTSFSPVGLLVWQYNYDGKQPAADATFDNLELWTYKVPTIRYVDAGSTNATPPYANWFTAARTIQDAVDAALAGDEIVVTNGIYASGGRAVGTNVLVNRVAVDKPLTVRSVNGSEFTIIQGYQVPGTTNGDGAIRCVYLANGASLSGFALTNGATGTNEDYYLDQSGGGVRCESSTALVSNCVVVNNSAAYNGGGAGGGTLNNCTLIGNSAQYGGGAASDILNNCTLAGNSAAYFGGGASGGTLNNCTLIGNSAQYGGGAASDILNNCTLTGNSAQYGGGASGSSGGRLNNCTLTGNSASVSAGGVAGGVTPANLNNCIVYFNTAPTDANYNAGFPGQPVLNNCCTTPQPTYGVGNITLDPQLASASHLSVTSPCRGAGSAAYTTGTDIDGEAWANSPSIGADEYHPGAIAGSLSVGIMAAYTNVAVGFPVDLTALIGGHASVSAWEFGDGVVASNRPYASHAWAVAGDYVVALRAYNEDHPAGVSATGSVHVVAQPVHYVAADSANPLPPFTTWATAATNIQDAVDVSVPGALVLVTNGTYATGGRAVYGTMPNRVAVTKQATVRSINGPQFTVIRGRQVPGTTNGDGAIRCVYLANGASLSGFTLTNGGTRTNGDYYLEQSGGGVWCESINAVVSNCVLVGNSAAACGGGAYNGTLNNCVLTGNSASASSSGGGAADSILNNCTVTGNSAGFSGGGALVSVLYNCTLTGNSATRGGGVDGCSLYNCTLTGNSAQYGGGACGGILNNCIVYFNTASNGANYDQDGYWGLLLNYCCTTPQPTDGVGSITKAPRFVDYAGGNLRLQSNSPCINAGNNAYAPGPTDLDGLPRIVSATVDIGAYEFQGPGSLISYAWLQQYGLPTDGSADFTDPDADGRTTWQEWRCLSDPTNALSVLRLLSASPTGTNVTVSWQSVEGVSYFLERSTNLSASPPFTPVATGIPGQPGTTTYTDTNAASLAPLFYRVGVGD